MPEKTMGKSDHNEMIIFASFETEYFALGGLGAVMKLLPLEVGVEKCIVVAPFFRKLIDPAGLVARGSMAKATSLLTFSLGIGDEVYPVEVIEALNDKGLRTYFISSPEFFNAPENPYLNPRDPLLPLDPSRNPINQEALTEDALFFSIATPAVIAELIRARVLDGGPFTFHLQDWEAAAIAQSVRRTPARSMLDSARCVMTIHNPYDRPLHRKNSPRVCRFAEHLGLFPGRSILEQVIPMLDAPVSTVSTHFAHELTSEVLYTRIFCPHLQQAFQTKGLVGIDNGIFGDRVFPFSHDAEAEAGHGSYAILREEKWNARQALGSVVNNYRQQLIEAGRCSVWGGPLDLEDPAVPVFFVLGRDDPRQKGFDTVVGAIRKLPRGSARFVFAVMPGDEGLKGLGFLERLARERPGDVCVFPMRVEKSVFTALQRGCSYLLMASMYEPFGAASEGYLCGLPVVARATGGLIQQVVPHAGCMKDDAIMSPAAREIVAGHHRAFDRPTGILFREKVSPALEASGWREIVDCGYWEKVPKVDRVDGRRSIKLVQGMVKSAAAALRLAMDVYRDQDAYSAMIYNGWNLLPEFTWKRAVEGYHRHLYKRDKAEG